MTVSPRTLQERLRELTCDGYDGPYWTAQKHQAMHEATQLLAEAREALEPFAKIGDSGWPDHPQEFVICSYVDDRVTIKDIRNARAVLAKIEAATPPAEGDGS